MSEQLTSYGTGDNLAQSARTMATSRDDADEDEEMVAYGGYSNTAKTARHIQTRTVTRSAPATAGSGVSSLAFVAVDARKQQVLLHRQRHHGDKPVDPEVLAVIKEMFLPMTSYRDSKKHNFGADSMQQQQHWLIGFCDAISGTMPWASKRVKARPILKFIEYNLRGIGQVFFMNNPVTGLFILLGLLVQSPTVALHGLIGLCSSNLVAVYLGFDEGLLRSGLFGYNGVLTGLALAEDNWDWPVVVAIIVAAGLTSVVFVALGKLLVPYKVPPFTLPFNICTITYLLATRTSGRLMSVAAATGALSSTVVVYPDFAAPVIPPDPEDCLRGIARGVGQVFLADSVGAAIFIFIGLAICSRITAMSALLGSALGFCMALATGAGADPITAGLYGYNASLTCAALFGMFYVASLRGLVVTVSAAMITASFGDTLGTLMAPYGVAVYTLPFCIVTLLFVLVQGAVKNMIAVPLAEMTYPEEHFRRVSSLRSTFKMFAGLLESQRKPTLALSDRVTKPGKDKTLSEIYSLTTVRKVFKTIDADNSGEIDLTEIESMLMACGAVNVDYHFLQRLFHIMDTDESGAVDFDEFLVFVETMHGIQKIKQDIDEFFAFADHNGSGAVDMDEVLGAQDVLGTKVLKKEDVEQLMKMVGTHDSGEEFLIEELVCSIVLALVPRQQVSAEITIKRMKEEEDAVARLNGTNASFAASTPMGNAAMARQQLPYSGNADRASRDQGETSGEADSLLAPELTTVSWNEAPDPAPTLPESKACASSFPQQAPVVNNAAWAAGSPEAAPPAVVGMPPPTGAPPPQVKHETVVEIPTASAAPAAPLTSAADTALLMQTLLHAVQRLSIGAIGHPAAVSAPAMPAPILAPAPAAPMPTTAPRKTGQQPHQRQLPAQPVCDDRSRTVVLPGAVVDASTTEGAPGWQ